MEGWSGDNLTGSGRTPWKMNNHLKGGAIIHRSKNEGKIIQRQDKTLCYNVCY